MDMRGMERIGGKRKGAILRQRLENWSRARTEFLIDAGRHGFEGFKRVGKGLVSFLCVEQ